MTFILVRFRASEVCQATLELQAKRVRKETR